VTKRKDPGEPEHEDVTKLRTGGKTRKAAKKKTAKTGAARKTAARKTAKQREDIAPRFSPGSSGVGLSHAGRRESLEPPEETPGGPLGVS